MLFRTIIKVALRSLWAHKLRSFLAMLGIIIGVASVISMLALGGGAQSNVMARISSMGTNLLVLMPGQAGMRGVMTGTRETLTMADAQAILKEVPNVRQVAPVVRGNAQVKYLNKNSRTSVFGTTLTYMPIRNSVIAQGRSFTEAEAEARLRVAILGPTTAENLFGDEDPLDKTIKLNGINFHVIGVLKAKGSQGPFNADDQVIVPLAVAMKQLFGLDYLNEIDVEAVNESFVKEVQQSAAALLHKRHRIQDGAPDDFQIFNQAEMLETASSFTRMFTILLGGIASISLLVGGIGIMNVMLVTVTERTREIGIRKAVGARDRDILKQFLIEAVLMTTLGGGTGVAIGAGASKALQALTQYSSVISSTSILLAISFSGAVGVFFGFYPAWRAAKLDPIEALRYE